MLNTIQKGDILNVTLAAAVVSGQAAKVGVAFGVYASKGEIGDVVPFSVHGVYEIEKDNSDVAAFALLYWDDTAKKLTTTATSNTKAGYAIEAAGTAATTVKIKLVPTL